MSEFRNVLLVVSAGIVGGLLTNIPALGEPQFWAVGGNATWWKFVIGPMLMGGAAAGIGVFVLTNTDTAQRTRMFFFALICGLASPAIISNATEWIAGSTRSKLVDQLAQEKTAEVFELKDQNASPKQLAHVATKALELAGQTENASTRKSTEAAVDAAVQSLSQEQSSESTRGLVEIGTTAARVESYGTALGVIKELEKHAATSPDDQRIEIFKAQKSVFNALPGSVRSEFLRDRAVALEPGTGAVAR